ncbi:carbonic anhydrase [Pontibacter populi]|uniref:carbonic anhydrase n=1 Tax=Pontibacter populi TaxID=890055 RepID=A0ABV1RXP5_9BACT
MKKTKFMNRFCQGAVLTLAMLMGACGSETESTVESVENAVKEDVASAEEEWDYENTNWENISDSECRSNVQSPVDIKAEDVIEANLEPIKYNYTPFDMRIVDTGHAVQVYGTENSSITVEGKEHQFKQFHFHYPAEHTVDGKRYPLEMHLVHQEKGSDNLAVLGIFIEEGEQVNEFLEKVFVRVPEEKEKEVQTDVTLTLSDYIPPAQTHYTYTGSLTTPPCTVGVDWVLYKEPIKASQAQLENFAKYYSNNARPVQPLNNRKILKTME